MKATLEKLQAAYAGDIQVARVDADLAQSSVQDNAVQSIPTVLLFESGSLLDRLVGPQGEAALRGKIDKHL